MKIQKPLKSLPTTLVQNTTRTSKYQSVYDSLMACIGLWVPVSFPSPEDAKLAQMSVYVHFKGDKQHVVSTVLDREKSILYCMLEKRATKTVVSKTGKGKARA